MPGKFNPIISPSAKFSFADCLKSLRTEKEWIIQEAPAAPWYWWLSSTAWIQGLAQAGYSPGNFATYCVGEVGTLVVNRIIFLRLAKKLIKKELAGQSVIRRWLAEWQAIDKRYNILVSRILNTKLDGLPEKKFLQLFENFCALYFAVESLPLANEFLIPYSDELLGRLHVQYPDQTETLARLIAPCQRSFIQIEEDELKQIARLAGQKREEALTRHLKKWLFINGGYDGPHSVTRWQLQTKLKKIKNHQAAKPTKIGSVSFLDQETKIILRLISLVSGWKDQRKRNNMIGSVVLDHFARSFSSRYQIDYDLIRYAVPGEYRLLAKADKKFLKILRQRIKGGTAWAISGKRYSGIFSEIEYRQLRRVIGAMKKPQTMLKGLAASPGRVRGWIRVIHNPAREKFAAGSILLTSMTRPEFVPLIKKAKAVLCDEGGLLSHAAIVSREFKIPCIVGLHQAMASLRDGDWVEVDANHGLVKILKHN
ncbi:MAG: PEP-utilizing enzyme [Patescibacteria group bacterium]